METIVIVFHMIAALAIIGLILLQQGKGAEMGASFGGGGSQTLFGSRGSGNFFSRATAIIAAVFFATSFSLAIIAKEKAGVGEQLDISVPVEEIPVVDTLSSDVPVVESSIDSDMPSIEQSIDEVGSDIPTVEDIEIEVPAEN